MRTLVGQRKRSDCGIAALAAYLHIPYEDVYATAVQIAPKVSKTGLLMREVQAVASKLGRPLIVKRRPDLEADSGVLGVLWGKSSGHWVALIGGKVVDGDPHPEVWADADEYLAAYKGRPGFLLTEDK